MKQTMKKLTALLLACICVFAMAATVFAQEDAVPAEIEEMLLSNSEGILNSLFTMSDDELEELKTGKDVFGATAATAWETSRKDVGAFQSITKTVVTREEATEVYKTTSDVVFENYEAEVSISYDMNEGSLTGFKIDVDYPMSKLMMDAAMNTVLGIGTVFVMLLFLTGVISLFGVFGKLGKKKEALAPASAPAAVSGPEEAVTDDTELAAVIAAAIAASENTATDSFVVRSIKKVNKSRWQRA